MQCGGVATWRPPYRHILAPSLILIIIGLVLISGISANSVGYEIDQASDNTDEIEFSFEVDRKFSPIGKKKHALKK